MRKRLKRKLSVKREIGAKSAVFAEQKCAQMNKNYSINLRKTHRHRKKSKFFVKVKLLLPAYRLLLIDYNFQKFSIERAS